MYGVGTNGQNATVTATPNMSTHTVGDNISLKCVAENASLTNLMYMWSCSGCFADGNTASTVNRSLTDMDSSVISCSIIDGNDTYISAPFNLTVTGTYLNVNRILFIVQSECTYVMYKFSI